jgi:RNA polymerase sigma-54 factor
MINQSQTQKLQHKILPQQIALLNLFHLDSLAFEQRIEEELAENPLLEENNAETDPTKENYSKEEVQDYQSWDEYGYDDIPDYKTEYEHFLPENKIPDRPLVAMDDFREDLKSQFRLSTDSKKKQALADFLIDSIDDHGFLCQDLETIAEQISFKNHLIIEKEDLEGILEIIKRLDPPGIGSVNLQEYFMIQLNNISCDNPFVEKALQLVGKHFDDLRNANIEKIKKSLMLEEDDMKGILHVLGTLKTKPINQASGTIQPNLQVRPDFLISLEGEDLQVALANPRSTNLHISQVWIEKVQNAEQDDSSDRASKLYLRSKLSSAQWFIKAIQEREMNMLKVMRAIVRYQKDYFLNADPMLLKPMALKNIADMVNLDISTVSRITCNKYADTAFGMILLKSLFTEGLVNKDGENISNKVIRTVIEDVVKKEDKKKPFTDQQLVRLLADRGYNVARRTIAKYRDQLNIPVAHMRSIWA